MKIAIVGATGVIGQRIAAEALRRGHQVTAVARDPGKVTGTDAQFTAVQGDALDAESMAGAVRGADAVVSAVGPGHTGAQPDSMVLDHARALIAGAKAAGVRRVLAVGGAGSLEVAPGVQLVDTPEFPAAWKGIALAHRDVLELWRGPEAAELEWTYASPAALIEPGERTGTFRTGNDTLLTDAQGNSRISAEDFAVAVVDELEQQRHVRSRFTVAY
ncbi:MAG: 3 beta-hydroxysteroid dehydrogenase/Delta 5--_4-isomerase [Gemmatimonadetes bacterium]|nr:3 beta-hydroxysteroid dehydrogenase/Delta 5-->4-isomerase [Gemmatimonadota bacterium]